MGLEVVLRQAVDAIAVLVRDDDVDVHDRDFDRLRGLREAVPRLRDAVAEAGRDPSSLEVAPMAVIPDAGKFDHYEEIGCTEVVIDLPSAPAEEVLPLIDSFAAMVAARR